MEIVMLPCCRQGSRSRGIVEQVGSVGDVGGMVTQKIRPGIIISRLFVKPLETAQEGSQRAAALALKAGLVDGWGRGVAGTVDSLLAVE